MKNHQTSDSGFGAKSFAEGFEEGDIDNSELKFSYAGKKVLRKLVKVFTVRAKFLFYILVIYGHICRSCLKTVIALAQ